MSLIEVLPLESDLVLDFKPDLVSFDAGCSATVDSIWTAHCQANPKLFDAPVVCVSGVSLPHLTCTAVPYRFFYAQRHDPKLKEHLHLSVLAVSGCIRLKNGILFGKRSLTVTQYPGFWELVPSGTLDANKNALNGKLDYFAQLKEEFTTELNLDCDVIERIQAVAVILDKNELTYDICCILDAPKLAVPDQTNGEYGQFVSVPESALAQFLKDNQTQIVPTTAAFLDLIFPAKTR